MGNIKIPKIIHQTYKSYDSIPLAIKKVNNRLKESNPDWEYRFYDDQACKDYIAQNYGQNILNLYNSINPIYGAAKADLFRYLVIYHDGGAYFDIKSTCSRPLSEIITPDDEILFSFWEFAHPGHKELRKIAYSEIPQWYIIAKPKSPFLKAVIDQVLYNIEHYSVWQHRTNSVGVFRTTGPVVYTKTILPLLKQYPNTFKQDISDYGFIYSGLNKYIYHKKLYKAHYSIEYEPVILPKNHFARINFYIYYLLTTHIRIYWGFKRLLPDELRAYLKKYKIFKYL